MPKSHTHHFVPGASGTIAVCACGRFQHLDPDQPAEKPEKPERWVRVWAFPSLTHLCDMSCEEGREYDPRIGGDGNIITQECDPPVYTIAGRVP